MLREKPPKKKAKTDKPKKSSADEEDDTPEIVDGEVLARGLAFFLTRSCPKDFPETRLTRGSSSRAGVGRARLLRTSHP